MSRLLELWRERNDPLHKNAIYLMASNVVASVFGFFFWMVVARNYSVEDTGLATALISAMMLLVVFARMGFDFSLVRFLPSAANRREMINTCITITGLVALGLAVGFVLGVDKWSPALAFIKGSLPYSAAFILFTAVMAISLLQGQAFVGLRNSKFAFLQAILNGARLPIVMAVSVFSVLGIFSSVGIAAAVVVVVSLFVMMKVEPGYKPIPTINRPVFKSLFKFSFGNYIATDLAILPNYIMPLLIVSLLGAESSAYFYVGFSVAGILGTVASSTGLSLITESGYEPDKLRHQFIKSTRLILLGTGAGIGLIFLFGQPVLHWFSPQYAENATTILWVSALSWLPAIPNTLFLSVSRIKIKIKPLLMMDGAMAGLTIGFAYFLMQRMGAIGAALAFLIAQGIVACFTTPSLLKQVGISLKDLVRRHDGNS